jgi:hypothetical protein
VSLNIDAIGGYMDGMPTTGGLADAAASTPVNTGGGFNLGGILQGGITAGLDALLGGLFGGGSSGGSGGSGPFSEGLGELIQAGPAAYFDNELVERATQRVNAETLKNLNQLRNTLNDIAYLTGQSTPEFVNRTEGRFQNYLEPAAQRGYNFLNTYPAKYGQTLAGDSLLQRFQIDDYLESYSNLNRPTYMNQATNPTTVSMKMNEMEDVANTYMNKFKEASDAGGLMNYMDQQSQSFIQGAGAPDLPDVPDVPEYRQKASKFYSKDRGVQDLMTYSSY